LFNNSIIARRALRTVASGNKVRLSSTSVERSATFMNMSDADVATHIDITSLTMKSSYFEPAEGGSEHAPRRAKQCPD
jgi:hypothetical protein